MLHLGTNRLPANCTHYTKELQAMIIIRRIGRIRQFCLQILNPNPFPGLTLSPVYGIVPVGGVSLISATLTPNAVMKFDSQVKIAVRSGKQLELRVSGTVEPPLVDIDLVSLALSIVRQICWIKYKKLYQFYQTYM